MSMKEELIEKIQNKTLCMGVCGLGYVGLPLAVDKAKHGFRTIGFDVQQEKVDMVNAGKNYIGDVVDADLEKLVNAGMLSATTDFSRVCDVDFIAICVPTPLDKHQQPDISYVRDSTIAISKHLRRGSMVVLESTTYPGTTEELIRPILEEGNGLKCGEDFYLGFSPERVDPGNLIYKTSNTPKVVGAIGADATEVISMVYRSILDGDVTTVSSPAVAEMEKILENTYRNVNIGLINELAILCNKMGIDIWEVVDAAKTKPYGFQAFYPGPGLGGHCIPLDPYYLSWKARGITSAIRAAASAKCTLALAGPISPADYEAQLRKMPEFSSVDYRGVLAKDQVAALLQTSRVGLSPLLNQGQYWKAENLATKICEYLAMGLPVVMNGSAYNRAFVERWHCGICVDPENVEEIASAIRYLLDHPEEARQMGENGRQAVREEFNWGVEEKKLLALYEEIFKE